MLTSSQSAAIHCALILGLPEPQAAKLAGIPFDQAQNAISQVEPFVRGRKIDFARWLAGGDPIQCDPRLLFYEIQLGRLEYQHDECVCSWRRTKEHADKLYERLPEPIDAAGKAQKPFIGDIRFLQLAKNIRREMEKIEKLIAERIEELQKQPLPPNHLPAVELPKSIRHTTTHAASASMGIAAPPASEAIPTPALPPSNSGDAGLVSKDLNHAATAFLTALHGGSENKSTHARKPIPTIEPPPRKRDKYSGVNR